jgi:hypothetical protein
MPRIESSTCTPAGAGDVPDGAGVDVVWNGYRPLYRVEGRSEEDRARAHGCNLALRRLDLSDYERFVEAHVQAARSCESHRALLLHGRFRDPQLPPRPAGLTRQEHAQLDRIESRFRQVAARGLRELGAIRLALEGRPVPLGWRAEASLGLTVAAGGRELGLEASLPRREVAATARVHGLSAAASLERDGGAADRLELHAAGASWTFVGDRVESFSFEHGAAFGKVSGSAVTVGVKAERRFGREDGPVRIAASVKAAVTVNGIDAETVREALSPEDAWAIRSR